ncbi:hypothetical protein [Rathayibacter sp. AY1C5]|uniref:hypothetical protein n=1 Tax=Rathayibacter sp. AY1C5 TaxID=2080538 RepID=UPI000CE8F336|nr:hypothetical protein [Rathayibacter sp. AY1C5]PPG61093.1 hypothetical protein C5C57_03205 [Rathayibacter sp. AY1C5]
MPEWWSQRFAPEGSAAADGIKKQLGQPRLDPLTVLAREAAQNSWDARAGREVRFNIDISRLGDRADVWRDRFQSNLPSASGLFNSTEWNADTLVMTVSDRGTVGLGGPTRADLRVEQDERPDFVQFLRNVGEPRNQSLGGGTYGFGKGIYYSVSKASAILVDTHAVDRKAGRRVMGAAMTHKWEDGDEVYTGRHWWGDIVGGVPDPVTGEEAAALSSELGLPGFAEGEHGTDVIIIDPSLGMFDTDRDRTVEEAIAYLRSSMVWHLWPKTIEAQEGVVLLSTSVNGLVDQVPSADRIPSMQAFVIALEKARRQEGQKYERKREPFDVGVLALQISEAHPSDSEEFGAACPLEGPRRHVARMRRVELVVDYFVGEEHPDPRFGYVGVFIGSEEADEVFGRAEPPTHDAWVLAGLRGTDLGVVRDLGPFLRTRIQNEVNPRRASKAKSETAGLGRLAARLGSVTRSFSGTGAGADGPSTTGGGSEGEGSGGGGGSRKRRAAKPRFVEGPDVVVENDTAFLRALVEVPSSDEGQSVIATAQIVLESGGTEEDPPEGTAGPEFEWRSEQDDLLIAGPILPSAPDAGERWWLTATVVDDAAVRLSVDWNN